MNGSLDVLVVRGFAMREGRGKWACCYEVRLATARDEPLLYRGELHGRSFASESAAVLAAREAGSAKPCSESTRSVRRCWLCTRIAASTTGDGGCGSLDFRRYPGRHRQESGGAIDSACSGTRSDPGAQSPRAMRTCALRRQCQAAPDLGGRGGAGSDKPVRRGPFLLFPSPARPLRRVRLCPAPDARPRLRTLRRAGKRSPPTGDHAGSGKRRAYCTPGRFIEHSESPPAPVSTRSSMAVQARMSGGACPAAGTAPLILLAGSCVRVPAQGAPAHGARPASRAMLGPASIAIRATLPPRAPLPSFHASCFSPSCTSGTLSPASARVPTCCRARC